MISLNFKTFIYFTHRLFKKEGFLRTGLKLRHRHEDQSSSSRESRIFSCSAKGSNTPRSLLVLIDDILWMHRNHVITSGDYCSVDTILTPTPARFRALTFEFSGLRGLNSGQVE